MLGRYFQPYFYTKQWFEKNVIITELQIAELQKLKFCSLTTLRHHLMEISFSSVSKLLITFHQVWNGTNESLSQFLSHLNFIEEHTISAQLSRTFLSRSFCIFRYSLDVSTLTTIPWCPQFLVVPVGWKHCTILFLRSRIKPSVI